MVCSHGKRSVAVMCTGLSWLVNAQQLTQPNSGNCRSVEGPLLPCCVWNTEICEYAQESVAHTLKQSKGAHIEPETGKDVSIQINKLVRGCVGSSSLGKEAFQAKAHSYVTKQGCKAFMHGGASSNTRSLGHKSWCAVMGAPRGRWQIPWGCTEGSNTFISTLFKERKWWK